jgi:cephalosporin hydroxylase
VVAPTQGLHAHDWRVGPLLVSTVGPLNVDIPTGPMEAVNDFLKEHDDFAVDPAREKYLLTQNPQGWLKRLH